MPSALRRGLASGAFCWSAARGGLLERGPGGLLERGTGGLLERGAGVLLERGAGVGQVIGGNHDLHAPEGRVGKLDVDVGLGKLPGQLAEGAGLVRDIGHQHLALVGDPHPGAFERLPAPGNGLVVNEQVDDTPALTGERRKTANTDPDFASDLPQPGKLSRPVFKNHSQVRGHRIFDTATSPAPGGPGGSDSLDGLCAGPYGL